MNASLTSSQSPDLHIMGDPPNLERVLQRIAESVRVGGSTAHANPQHESTFRPVILFTAEQAEELVQVEMGDRVYSLMCWFRQPVLDQSCLSPREREVVRLVASGLPNKSIAHALQISSWTVATYMRRIFAKLDVCSRAEMVAKALKEGLLLQDDSALLHRHP